MIYRVVRMVFSEESKQSFIDIFFQKQSFIESFPGCNKVELVEDTSNRLVVGTLSQWEKEEDLEAYRKSELFLSTWKEVKPLFTEKARAWSYERI